MTPDRFFSLLLTLRSRETTTTADLAAQVGVSVRTVLRDLQWLQEAGFPLLIRRGRWGGVTLLPGGMLDTSRLTSSERDHLALYGLDDMQREQLGAAAGTRRAHQKMRSTLRLSNTDVLPLSAVVTTDNRPWFSRDIEGLPPAALVGDLRRGVRLRICYRRSDAARPGAAALHPVLFQDNLDDGGYRIASLIDVDVASLDRHQLTRLMLAVLGHVQARLLHGAGEQAAAAGTQVDSAD